ncbi:MAG: ABC transporter ATP-binding protein [Phycisphaerales bacterium]|nr:MAG: ABC transporter ATP-binding protein [Phycisphaerales bacterium]
MTAAPTAQPVRTPDGEPRPEPVFRVEDLAVSFDNGKGSPRVQAVDGVRMSVYPHQTLAVVGESGCGKSVTAMSALQLVPRPPGRFDRGRVLYRMTDGASLREIDLLTLEPDAMRRVRGNEIAMIFQEPMTSLNPVFTIGDQLVEAIRLHQGVSKSGAADVAVRAMQAVGIPDPAKRLKAYPHQFSGGMRQRVMIAMALACEPRVLLADEPTTALDVTIQAQILDLITDLKRDRGLAVMLITHDLGIVAQHADVVCVMYAGRVVEYAPVEALFERRLHPYTRGLLASIPALGERRERLRTVSEIVDDEASFASAPGLPQAVRPWWPWHQAPAGLVRAPGPAGDYALLEAQPGHWVGVWRTEAVASADHRPPDSPPPA